MTTDPWTTPTTDLPAAPPPRLQERAHDPIPAGAARCTVEVICCPLSACHSLHVRKVSTRVGELRHWWQCQECDHRWPEPAMIGGTRAAIP